MCCHCIQGRSHSGQLGYEDTETRGDEPDEMGDNLPVINFGTGFVVEDFIFKSQGSCVLSTSGQVKCWGYSGNGQALGYGDSTNRGDTAGSMGDALPFIELGSGFSENGLRLASSQDGGNGHICVYEESSEFLLKCWGSNYYNTRYGGGQLGLGDTEHRGDEPGEMGDNLPFVDLGFTLIVPPTSAAPTSIPTMTPSVSPTDPLCDVDAMYGVNWHNLVRPHSVYTFMYIVWESECILCANYHV